MPIGHLPTGSKGFDINAPVSASRARAFYAAGYRFAVRYVGRVEQKSHDVSSVELGRLLHAGLSVMLVQHVKSAESWEPTPGMGYLYGTNAALFADGAGYARGAVLWCDLEGVAVGTPTADVIGFCNEWHRSAKSYGYEPGLYVGWHCGLSAHDLYWKLRFALFWGAFNLNRDQYPVVRGACMRQFAATPADRVTGVALNAIDVNVIGKDALGGTPTLMLAPGDR